MAVVPLDQATTLAQLQAYAGAASSDAVRICPSAVKAYASALQYQDFNVVKGLLASANASCHAEAYGPGGIYYGKAKPSSTTAPTLTVGAAASSGTPWWLILGGIGLVGWLLFGKKGRKKRRR